MEKLYRETKTNLLQLNEVLSKFEKSSTPEDIQLIKAQIQNKFNEITSACDQLDNYVIKEPPNRKYDAKLKVDQLKYDFSHFKTAFNTIQYKKEQKILEEKRREELLRSTNIYAPANTGHVQLFMDHEQNELRHHNRLSKANDEMDRMIDHGENVLKNIQTQNTTLKDIKRKIFSISNSLGLSNTLIRMIERRNTSDKYILYGGMIITCIIMFLAVKYLI